MKRRLDLSITMGVMTLPAAGIWDEYGMTDCNDLPQPGDDNFQPFKEVVCQRMHEADVARGRKGPRIITPDSWMTSLLDSFLREPREP